jgi:multidrug efflux system outer membrane protein
VNTIPLKPGSAVPLLAVLMLAGGLGGCVLGPDYKAPEVAPPAEFRSQLSPADATSLADLPWWDVFRDEVLQGLISESLANNYDLKIAIARIEQARAVVGVVRSQYYPQVGYEGFAEGNRAMLPGPNGGSTSNTYGTLGGLLSLGWEFDVWGRIKRSEESARARLLAQESVRRAVMLSLVSDVAANYFSLLELDRELAIADESARVFKQTLDLFSYRYEAGKDSHLPVERAQANYDASQARIADLRREIVQQENALSVLLGAYPRPIERGRPLVTQSTPETPVGLSTELLRRRPDILEAEQNMISANAEIGVAVANFYPRIGLSARAGGGGLANDDFTGFSTWNAIGNVAGPLFTGGRLEAIYQERQAYWDETVARYKKTVLLAFRETSDALIARQALADRLKSLQSQVRSLRQSVDTSLLRYDSGRASYFEVLEAQQRLFPAEDDVARTQQAQLVAVVNLYKALGGGWQLKEDEWTQAR